MVKELRILIIVTLFLGIVFSSSLFSVISNAADNSNIDPIKSPITGYGKFKLGAPISRYVTASNIVKYLIDEESGYAVYWLEDREIFNFGPYSFKAFIHLYSSNPNKFKGRVEVVSLNMSFVNQTNNKNTKPLKTLEPFRHDLLNAIGRNFSQITPEEYENLKSESFTIKRKDKSSSNFISVYGTVYNRGLYGVSLSFSTKKYQDLLSRKTK